MLTVTFGLAALAPTAEAAPAPPQLDARAWVLIDASDGDVLAAERPERSYPIASTTKLMTALVARDRLKLGETVVAPAYAANPAESLLGLTAGERIEVRDLLYGLLLASGNDAAVALAEASAGSEGRFVALMNRRPRACCRRRWAASVVQRPIRPPAAQGCPDWKPAERGR